MPHGRFGRMKEATSLNNFKGKKVFVTGHTGFKGSWLVAWLHLLGAKIKGYALQPEHESGIYQSIHADELCESIIGDIRDEKKLTDEILKFNPDYVFHLAAQPLVRLSYDKPVETFDVNVTGTANLLNAVRQLNGSCTVVVITTDKVYENLEWAHPYREVDALGGYDPYSASKACTELVVSSFRQSFFNTEKISDHGKVVASARAGNVIGGGDWSQDRIIPDIVKSLESGKTVSVRNPHAIRPWQFVLEPIHGYLLLALALDQNPVKHSGAYNFGPQFNDFLPVSALVETALKKWGSGNFEVPKLENQPHEAGILKLDISKAVDHLKWMPRLHSAEAIQWSIDWYKKDRNEKRDFTFDQIKKYQQFK